MSLESKELQNRIVRREVPAEIIFGAWGLPDGGGTAIIIDESVEDYGPWAYRQIIFEAPDDGLTYELGYDTNDFDYMLDGDTVEITQVTNVPETVVVDNWIPVYHLPVRSKSEQRRLDSLAAAEDATWD